MTAPLTAPTETWEQEFDRVYDAQVERQERHDRECTRRQELLAAFAGEDLWTAPEGFGRALTIRERLAVARVAGFLDVGASAENGWTGGDETEENDKLEALLHKVRAACQATGPAQLNESRVHVAIKEWARSVGHPEPRAFARLMFAPQPNTGPWTPEDWAVVKAERAKGRPLTPDEKAMIHAEHANDTKTGPAPANDAGLGLGLVARLRDRTEAPALSLPTCKKNDKLQTAEQPLLVHLLSTGVWEGVFRFNTLSRRIEAINPPGRMRLSQGCLSKGDIGKVGLWLADQMEGWVPGKRATDKTPATEGRACGLKAKPADIGLAIETVAEFNPYNPIVDYFDSLPHTDGTPELDSAWETILRSPDGPIASTLLKKHMVAAVRRVRGADKGQSVDHQAVLIFCGKQDGGKTQTVKALGGAFYVSITGDLRNKDTTLKMQGKLCVDLEEMSTAKKADRDMLKAFLSRSEDYERAAYAANAESVPRSYVLFGSSNALRLDDPTGLRRFWCITVGNEIDWRRVTHLRDVLWAEANTLAATDFDHHLTPEEKRHVAGLASAHEEEDPLADQLRGVLRGIPFVKLNEAWLLAEGTGGQHEKKVIPNADKGRYGDALRRIGARNDAVNIGPGKTVRGWVIPDEIANAAVDDTTVRISDDPDVHAARLKSHNYTMRHVRYLAWLAEKDARMNRRA